MSADRLSVVDDIFLRTHRGYGLPILLQGIWRSHDEVDRVDLAAAHANLALGRLGRRVVTPRTPGARRRWAVSNETLPLAFEPLPLAERGVLAWADAQGEVDLDPEYGPGWRMSVAATETGGTVVSLVCSHTLADAAGLISAAGTAFEGHAVHRTTVRRTSDVVDAVALSARVATASARAVVNMIADGTVRRDVRRFMHTSSAATHPAQCSSAVFDVDYAPSNAEFISLAAEIAADVGEDDPVTVNVPFRSNVRGANAIGMATIEVTRRDTVEQIRRATKSAFSTPAGAPGGFPAEAVQLLSDARAASLTSSIGTARVLCSNIGALPSSILSIGGHRASSLATRAIHPNPGHSRTATALSAYISTTGSTSTLALVATEARIGPILVDRAAAVLARRGMRAKSW